MSHESNHTAVSSLHRGSMIDFVYCSTDKLTTSYRVSNIDPEYFSKIDIESRQMQTCIATDSKNTIAIS